jgi:hypothetical protein
VPNDLCSLPVRAKAGAAGALAGEAVALKRCSPWLDGPSVMITWTRKEKIVEISLK